MRFFRHISRPTLLPFTGLFYLGVLLRNLLFDLKILKTVTFRLPVISVGNITVGGTGKTPHVEYLVSLLHHDYQIAVLSRGYKRKTRQYLQVTTKSHPQETGDEPLQIKRKFPDVTVAVDRKRADGIRHLIGETRKLDAVILDDAYQHRWVKPGLSILLIDFTRPVYRDVLLPAGNLREPRRNIDRADILIVTKCPDALSPAEKASISRALQLQPTQDIFFTHFKYSEPVAVFPGKWSRNENTTFKYLRKSHASVLLVTGIANPLPLRRYIESYILVADEMQFPDHHPFTMRDVELIRERYRNLPGQERIILITEKDAVRLSALSIDDKTLRRAIFYVPFQVKFLAKGEKPFIKLIYKYLKKNLLNNPTQ